MSTSTAPTAATMPPTPSESIQSGKDLLARVNVLRRLELDCSVIKKGIDNYHVDIELDSRFVLLLRTVSEEVVKRVVAGKRPGANPDDMEVMRDVYGQMVKASLHRTKTDFRPAQVRVLHFGIVKFVLQEVRARLDDIVGQTEETLAQQQYAGSRSLLATQARFSWLRQHYPEFLYRAARTLLRHLQREENGPLRQLREQFLGEELHELPHLMFNPMLAAASPVDSHLLIDSYAMWPGGGGQIDERNAAIEQFLARRFKALSFEPLKATDRLESGQSEVYDELGGLFAAQPYLGPSVDQKEVVSETLCWFDQPGHVRLLFDATVHERTMASIEGKRGRWRFKSDARRLEKSGIEARRKFVNDAQLKEIVAGYVMRDEWRPLYDQVLDVAAACAYVAGHDQKKILAKIDRSKEGALGLIDKLDEWARETNRAFKEDMDEISLRVLTDLSRFRLHLKYYRFAHRVFNRLNVITDPQQIQLSKAGGHLYRLPASAGDVDEGPEEKRIIHHAILKADVRGSTVVTQELIKQGLNPASYFSTRFFGPINELLPVYGAVKVFIEGDAVILGVYEHNTEPEQWYAVSRACGIAKEMLDIVTSKNANARQTGVPTLEIGIGICYSDEMPLFLFDEKKPIMISPAIGDADRMSSSSWRLRDLFKSGSFNVEVLEIAESDRQRGEKGQHHIRYNVNGITLDNAAFSKLESEIQLERLEVTVTDSAETMYVGRFPDMRGKERDLVIREGRIGTWEHEIARPGSEDSPVFYEVLSNSKLASQVLEIARSHRKKAG